MTKLRNSLAAALFVAGGLFHIGAAAAQDVSESHLTAARAAVAAIQATDPYDAILPNVSQLIRQQLISNSPDLEAEISSVVDEATLAMVSRRADLELEAARAYAKAFSEEDLNAIATFYQSEAGKALIANGPIAAREVNDAALIWQRGIERDLLANVSAKLNEMGLRTREETAPAEGATEGAAPAQNQ